MRLNSQCSSDCLVWDLQFVQEKMVTVAEAHRVHYNRILALRNTTRFISRSAEFVFFKYSVTFSF